MTPLLIVDHPRIQLRFRPLTATRSLAQLKLAYYTIHERWNCIYSNVAVFDTQHPSEACVFVYSHIIPNNQLLESILNLKPGECLVYNTSPIAWHGVYNQNMELFKKIEYQKPLCVLKDPLDLIHHLNTFCIEDFEYLKGHTQAMQLPKFVTVIGNPELLFIEEGAIVSACYINTQNGPVFISAKAQIMEGAMVRGPFIMGAHAELKMGAKIYGPTAVGSWCKIGGELNQCLFQDFSNKAHDGFLGQSLIGSWCNLGADTNCSNLKNNYSTVKQYRYDTQTFEDTGAQFAGIIMGDHCKTGINTMLNTGTVLGVAAHVYGAGFPPQYIPDFTWYDGKFFQPYIWTKFIETAQRVMERRNKYLNASDSDRLLKIYQNQHA